MATLSISDCERLFREHNKNLCDLAYNMVRDQQAAQDIVQEVFLSLWKNRARLDFGEKIRNYLFRATAHQALNHLRSSRRLIRFPEVLAEKLEASADTEGVQYKELELRVREAIDRLPDKCRVIYLLSRQEGLKYSEIAETLGLSVKTVENQMGIALGKLRDDLKPFLLIGFLVALIVLGWIFFDLFA
jgi:RNA polymerase sigma-70 factor (ECF subfamily)